MLGDHRRQLAALAGKDRLRALAPRRGRDFASNDYLALSADPRLKAAVAAALDRGVPIGSGGSRLLRGNDPEHEALEEEAARFFGAEAALLFASGFAANTALLAALPGEDDLIVADALIHASSHDGLRLARAGCVLVPHNDAGAVEAAIEAWRAKGGMGRAWVLAESLYSMDGDRAPLEALAGIAARHDAFLVIDEAHATGVFGPGGRGLAAALQGAENVLTLHTLGKALGCEGAIVCLPAVLRDILVNRARPFVFSTAPSPLLAAAARGALRAAEVEPQRREELSALRRHAEARLGPLGATRSGSQILPLIIGHDGEAVALAERLQAAGFDVRAIRPPTVPEGTARLRISLTLHADAQAVDALAAALAEARA
ncbi:8-amino-7-oxononanoate synthase [Parvularcula oceani]|uniref:8-amino-7-oxononanoate synthase n=1 Tax=Parvularcula oceani TaxID=1247963 RepID=UPI0004E14B66|nr:8-amino-7-oxononanoate synthase [Parvularcula oceani]